MKMQCANSHSGIREINPSFKFGLNEIMTMSNKIAKKWNEYINMNILV